MIYILGLNTTSEVENPDLYDESLERKVADEGWAVVIGEPAVIAPLLDDIDNGLFITHPIDYNGTFAVECIDRQRLHEFRV